MTLDFDDSEFAELEKRLNGIDIDDVPLAEDEFDDAFVSEQEEDVIDNGPIGEGNAIGSSPIGEGNVTDNSPIDNSIVNRSSSYVPPCIEIDSEGNIIEDSTLDVKVSNNFAANSTAQTLKEAWTKRSVYAANETDSEFKLFEIYRNCGGGRSLQYVAKITNLALSRIHKVAEANKWRERTAAWDRHILAQNVEAATGARHEEHLKQLEMYRKEQQAIGQQMSVAAMRLAVLANNTLSEWITKEQNIDARDLPALLNAMAKIAGTGKDLQANSLGVDQLLSAMNESMDE